MEIDALVAPHGFDDVMSSMDGVSELASQVICKSQFCSRREQVLRTPNLSYPDHPSDKAAEEEQNRFYNLVLKSSEELLLMQKKPWSNQITFIEHEKPSCNRILVPL